MNKQELLSVDELFESLKEKIRKYNPQYDFWMLDKAFNLAAVAHSTQMRESGEAYIYHPLYVAHILADMELDSETIIAALLHDVVEDTNYTYENIKDLFGENIAILVEGVTKLGRIEFSSREERQIESFRKMFLAMAKDIRVILIKLADRLHNMRTLKSVSSEKQLIKAHETMEVYAPLAHRLGISKIKWELEDLSLLYLDPHAYHEISQSVSDKRQEREEYIEKIKEALTERLNSLGIKYKIEGRAKHFYSIYRKMFINNISIDEMYDLLAVRIIVDSISECYAALGLVHELYKPIPGRFKDYIAMPKNNMYQSLHTSVIGPSGKPFEIQIRTWDMHKTAEVGIAAHWKYKEGKSGQSDLDSKLEWVRQLIEIQKEHTGTDAEEFMRSVRVDLFEDEVFVFSPKGDVINLPNGACPVDFAYAIHSAIGNKTTGAMINKKIVPLDYCLQNGDIVEIITSSVPHGPSRDWLKFVKTSQARKKINDWFKKEHREENIFNGKETLEKELKRNGINLSVLQKSEYTEPICKKFTMNTMDDVYAAIGYGALPVTKVLSRIKDQYRKSQKVEDFIPLIDTSVIKNKKSDSSIIVKGIDNCLVRFARCCNPVPGDEIVGYITKGRGVSVHRHDCINARNLESSSGESGVRFIEVYWAESAESSFVTDIQVVAIDRQGLVLEITNIISENKLKMRSINARSTKEELAVIDVTLEIKDKTQLDKVLKAFRKIDGTTSVMRTKH